EGRARAAAERRRRMEELHREAEARVAAEAAAMDALTAQGRARFPELVPGLAEEMARRIGPGGRRP
ncbi:MAG TPA: Uma2 family endonuclease, partial [Candidatus Hydrogenedentes bacterium]|nr:Uma2 family endonuclease [Candidatus Hydrogenedentota bacterium]